MAQAPLKFGIKDFVQNYYFRPNFHFHFLIFKFFLKFPCKNYKKYWQISIYFRYQNSQWRAARRNLLFSSFFWGMTWSIRGMNFRDLRPALHEFPQTNSPKTPDIWPVSKKKYFTQNFGNLASYKKGLNKIGSKMAALKGFSFGHFSKT